MKIRLNTALLSFAIVTTGCVAGNTDAPVSGDVGHIEVPLTTVGSDGTTYVLQNAIIDVNGPTNVSVVDPIESIAIVSVPQGDYTVTLRDGWTLAIQHSDGTTTPIDAVLASKNPMAVRVEPTLVSLANLQFLTGSDNGSLFLSFGVATQVGLFAGKVHVTTDFSWDGDATHGNVENGFTGLEGEDVDVRARFGVTSTSTATSMDGSKHRTYFTTAARVGFSGDDTSYLAGELASRFTGNVVGLDLSFDPTTMRVTGVFDIYDTLADGSFVVMAITSTDLPFVGLDAEGFPTVTPGASRAFFAPTFYVERYVAGADNVVTRTGSMSGPGTFNLELPAIP